MTQVTRQRHAYVSPYLRLPARTLAEAQAEQQGDAVAVAPSEPEPEDKPPANDRQKE
jgi:hypothetical protein